MDAAAADDAMQRIGTFLYRRAPRPFEQVRLRFGVAGLVGSYTWWVTVDGVERQESFMSRAELADALLDLRRALYEEGKGGWYTAEIVVTAEGKISVSYDYDNPPDFGFELVPGTFVEDLEIYPRDEEHRPQWLKDAVAAAERE